MSVRSLSISSHGAARDWDSLQFRLIFAFSFMFHLVAAVSTRLSPTYWSAGSSHRSIFAQAVEAAGTTAQIAFYG